MKNIKQHFIVTKTDKGRKYILDIYEIVKKGEVKRIGVASASYGAHKGETSEAYTFLKQCGVIKPAILKAIDEAQVKRNTNSGSYYSYHYYSFADDFGLLIELL